jgi:hypothetical protein
LGAACENRSGLRKFEKSRERDKTDEKREKTIHTKYGKATVEINGTLLSRL